MGASSAPTRVLCPTSGGEHTENIYASEHGGIHTRMDCLTSSEPSRLPRQFLPYLRIKELLLCSWIHHPQFPLKLASNLNTPLPISQQYHEGYLPSNIMLLCFSDVALRSSLSCTTVTKLLKRSRASLVLSRTR